MSWFGWRCWRAWRRASNRFYFARNCYNLYNLGSLTGLYVYDWAANAAVSSQLAMAAIFAYFTIPFHTAVTAVAANATISHLRVMLASVAVEALPLENSMDTAAANLTILLKIAMPAIAADFAARLSCTMPTIVANRATGLPFIIVGAALTKICRLRIGPVAQATSSTSGLNRLRRHFQRRAAGALTSVRHGLKAERGPFSIDNMFFRAE